MKANSGEKTRIQKDGEEYLRIQRQKGKGEIDDVLDRRYATKALPNMKLFPIVHRVIGDNGPRGSGRFTQDEVDILVKGLMATRKRWDKYIVADGIGGAVLRGIREIQEENR